MQEHPGSIQRISAVTLLTSDMGKAVGFYEELGFHMLFGGAQEPFTSFGVGEGYLNLQFDPVRHLDHAIWGRVVFWVSDVDALHQRALEADLKPVTSPTNAPWGERYFHIRDPDGHELSFARPLTDV